MARPWLQLALWALAACVLNLTNQFAGAYVRLPGGLQEQALALLYLTSLLFCLLQATRAAAHLPQSALFLLLLGVAFAAPVLVSNVLIRLHIAPPLWIALSANNLFLPIAAALAGAGVGRVIKHPNTLLAAAGFALFFDIVMVTMGTVAVLLRKSPQTIANFSVGGGPSLPAARPLPWISYVTIGPADVLFLALFLAAIVILRLSERATVAWMFALLATALVVVQLFALPVPALAPMGVAVLIANARHGRFTREEKYALVYGGGFALALAAILVIGARHVLGHGP